MIRFLIFNVFIIGSITSINAQDTLSNSQSHYAILDSLIDQRTDSTINRAKFMVDSLTRLDVKNGKYYKDIFRKLLTVDYNRAYLLGWRILHTGQWSAGNEAYLYWIGVEATSYNGVESPSRPFDYDLAIECFKKVISITKTPSNIPVNYSLMAGAYYYKGDYKKGKEMMLKAISSFPEGTPQAEINKYKKHLESFEEKFNVDN